MPRPHPAHTELERALTRLARRVLLPTTGEATRRRAGVHLERATYATLVRIAELGDARLSEIAAALGLDASTTSRHIRRLVDAGYVTVTADPQDARARRHTATAAGHEALARVRDARLERLAEVLEGWDTDEVAGIAAGLDRLLDAFDADDRRQR